MQANAANFPDIAARLARSVFDQHKEKQANSFKFNTLVKSDDLSSAVSRWLQNGQKQKEEADKNTHGINFNAFAQGSHAPNVGEGQQLQAHEGINERVSGIFTRFMDDAKTKHQKKQEEQQEQVTQFIKKAFAKPSNEELQKLKVERDEKVSNIFAAVAKVLDAKHPVAAKEDKSENLSTFERVKRLANDDFVSRAVKFAFSRFDAKGPFTIVTSKIF